MSVISRLDGQVDEVIIKPVSRRRAPDETNLTETAPRGPASRPAEPRDTPQGDQLSTPDGARRDDGELPVWLL
jgi:hypothetical protein